MDGAGYALVENTELPWYVVIQPDPTVKKLVIGSWLVFEARLNVKRHINAIFNTWSEEIG